MHVCQIQHNASYFKPGMFLESCAHVITNAELLNKISGKENVTQLINLQYLYSWNSIKQAI